MKLELTLSELNELYYVVSKSVEEQTQFIKNMTEPDYMNYFVRELSKTKKLKQRLGEQLFNEVKELDESIPNYIDEEIEYVDSMNEAQLEDKRLGNI